MKKEIRDFTVVSKTWLNSDHFLIDAQSPTPLLPTLPGQFVEIRVDQSPETFLRRPISIHDVDYSDNIISLLIRVCGRGTQKLSELQAGDTLNMIYPLGNGFTIETGNYLLIGGGCGVAPLRYLARKLHEKGLTPDILIGARHAEALFGLNEYRLFGNVFITTEDGSDGEKGFVTQHSLLNDYKKFSRICTCGPDAMMKAVAQYARKYDIPCEVSLENNMACGIGACLCCVTETIDGHNRCVCTEGPVFDAKTLKF